MNYINNTNNQPPKGLKEISIEEIVSSTFACSYIETKKEGLVFHRFTKEQETIWLDYPEALFHKSQCPAGVRIECETDATSLWLEIEVEKGTSENYFSLEVYSNGEWKGNIFDSNNVNGVYSGFFTLPENTKTIRIDLPWSVKMVLHGLYLNENATFKPSPKKEKRILFLGDSLTQGYFSHNTSFTYPAIFTDLLGNAEGFNKGVGGAIFDERLGSYKDNFIPDYILTFYGTNNFAHSTREEFNDQCPKFFASLRKSYPDSKIYCITPIWRKDNYKLFECGDWVSLCNDIEIHAKNNNIEVIRGEKVFPEIPELMGDYRLHPHDRGFAILATLIYKEIFK